MPDHKSADNIKNGQDSGHTASLLTSIANPLVNDTGYNTQEDMSWRHCGNTPNAASEGQRNILIASTPTK